MEENEMSFKEFVKTVKELVAERSGKEVRINEVSKNNGVKYTGMMIITGSNIVPTIYLEQYWEMFNNGMKIPTIVDIILQSHAQAARENVVMDWFMDWESVKDKVAYKLINYDNNKDLLDKIPYTKFLDLAKVYYVIYEDDNVGSGTILIHNSHMDMWRVTIDQIDAAADINTPQKKPVWIRSMNDIVSEHGLEELLEDNEEVNFNFLVITNKEKCLGAGTICYKGVLHEIANSLQRDLIIIPSSIHECLLLKMKGDENLDNIKELVKEANSTSVQPEERLSDSVYIYRKQTDKIELA